MPFWLTFFLFVGTTIVAELLRPKPKFAAPRPSSLGDFQIPTAEEGRPIPVPFGRCRVKGINCVWYGNLTVIPITEKVKTGLFSSKRVTVGYKYYLSMQLGLCHGIVDNLAATLFGDKALAPEATVPHGADYSTLTFDDEELFGGKKKEGGVKGDIDFYWGTKTQTANSHLVATIGKPLPGYRTLCYAVLKDFYLGTSQYIKTIAFDIDRFPNGLDLENDHHIINGDANPFCVIYDLLTNTLYGAGIPEGNIDLPSFIACAETVFDEDLGISALLDNPKAAREFIGEVLRHVDGTMFADPATAKLTVRLARADYDPGDLKLLDESNSKDAEFSRGSWEETINTIRVKYTDRAAEFTEKSVPQQNLANIQSRAGWLEPEEYDFTMFSRIEVANYTAARVLKTVSYPLARASVVCDRTAYNLRPGSVVKYSRVRHSVSNMVMRITNIDYGELKDNRIRLDMVEDIFSITHTAYDPPPDSEWEPPELDAQPIASARDLEVPYYIIKNTLPPADLETLTTAKSFILLLARKPAGLNVSFGIYDSPTDQTEDFNAIGEDTFTPTAQLNGAIDWDTSALTIDTVSGDISELLPGFIAKIADEWVEFSSFDFGTGSATVKRGILDSIPVAHADNTVIWLYGGVNGFAGFEHPFPKGTIRFYRETSIGITGETPLDTAIEQEHVHAAEWFAPYPPANVKIFDEYYPTEIPGGFTIEWFGRNRLVQEKVAWTDAHAEPESGTTYTLRVYDADTDTLLNEYTGLRTISTGGRYNYPGPTGNVVRVRVELWSVRSGVRSTQMFSHEADLFGYGLDYGNRYGGSINGVILPRGTSSVNTGDQYAYVPYGSWINGAWHDFDSKTPYISPDDGDTWLAEAQPGLFTSAPGTTFITNNFYDFGGGYYSATSNSGVYYRRRDGGLWERGRLDDITGGGGNIQSITWDGGRFVMLTAGGFRIFTSTDLTSWSQVGADPNDLAVHGSDELTANIILKIGSQYVAIGAAGGKVYPVTSPDLVDWTRGSEIDADVFSLAGSGHYFNGAYFAFGFEGTGESSIMKVLRSTDGVTWSKVTIPGLAPGARMQHVRVFASTMRIVAGDKVYTSSNGTSWSSSGYCPWRPEVIPLMKGKLARLNTENGPSKLLITLPYYEEFGGKVVSISDLTDISATLEYPAGAPHGGHFGALDLYRTQNSQIFYPIFDEAGFVAEDTSIERGGRVAKLSLSGKRYFEVEVLAAYGSSNSITAFIVGAMPLRFSSEGGADVPSLSANYNTFTPTVGDIIGVLADKTTGTVTIRVNNEDVKTVTGLNTEEPWAIVYVAPRAKLYLNLGQNTFIYSQPGYSDWDDT